MHGARDTDPVHAAGGLIQGDLACWHAQNVKQRFAPQNRGTNRTDANGESAATNGPGFLRCKSSGCAVRPAPLLNATPQSAQSKRCLCASHPCTMAPYSVQSSAFMVCFQRPVHGLSVQHCAGRGVPMQPTPHTQEPVIRRAGKARCQQVASAVSSVAPSERNFMELAEMSGTGLNKVTARTTDNQIGLVATEAIEKGEMIIRVPLSVR